MLPGVRHLHLDLHLDLDLDLGLLTYLGALAGQPAAFWVSGSTSEQDAWTDRMFSKTCWFYNLALKMADAHCSMRRGTTRGRCLPGKSGLVPNHFLSILTHWSGHDRTVSHPEMCPKKVIPVALEGGGAGRGGQRG